jgi:hypothetical protein
VKSSGSFTDIYDFCITSCPAGADPDENTGLLQATDGNFYGATANYFKVTPSGAISLLYTFCSETLCEDGQTPLGLIQGSDGAFYGVATYGGNNSVNGGSNYGYGTIDRLAFTPALPAPVQVTASASSVVLGKSVTLNWKTLNAYSLTMQQCFASVNGTPAGAVLPSGSMSVTPTASGSYLYAITCGGIESGFANVTVN